MLSKLRVKSFSSPLQIKVGIRNVRLVKLLEVLAFSVCNVEKSFNLDVLNET